MRLFFWKPTLFTGSSKTHCGLTGRPNEPIEITCRATTWLPSNHRGLRCSNPPAEEAEAAEVDLEDLKDLVDLVALVDLVRHHPKMTI